jgi:protein arginine N-methyltransferase 3
LVTGLDLYERIKLINFVRTEVKNGNKLPDISSKAVFEDDKYLRPVLEDDAVLFSMDEYLDASIKQPEPVKESKDPLETRVSQLEREIAEMRVEYDNYRDLVSASMKHQLATIPEHGENDKEDSGYFEGYSSNGM